MKSAKHSGFRYDLKQSNIFWKWFSCSSVTKSNVLNRRTFLRGTGVCLALPMLDAMRPAFSAEEVSTLPRRLVAIETNMGILPQYFFPEKAGRDYKLSPYLERLAPLREQFTVFSGTSHPGVTGAHAAEKCFLTGTLYPERGGFRNWISLDQFAAEQLSNHTRYPSLVLAMTNENQTLSYTRNLRYPYRILLTARSLNLMRSSSCGSLRLL